MGVRRYTGDGGSTMKYDRDYTVSFTGDYMTLTTTVEAQNEDHAEQVAKELIRGHYGIDPEILSLNDIMAERV